MDGNLEYNREKDEARLDLIFLLERAQLGLCFQQSPLILGFKGSVKFVSYRTDSGFEGFESDSHIRRPQREGEESQPSHYGEEDDRGGPGESAVDVDVLEQHLHQGGRAPATVYATYFLEVANTFGGRRESVDRLEDVGGRSLYRGGVEFFWRDRGHIGWSRFRVWGKG